MDTNAVARSLTASCLKIVKGEGIYIWDDQGKQYIDGSSGSSFVCNIGHGVKDIADVMSAQAKQIAYNPTHCSMSEPFVNLSKRLAQLSPGDLNKIFF